MVTLIQKRGKTVKKRKIMIINKFKAIIKLPDDNHLTYYLLRTCNDSRNTRYDSRLSAVASAKAEDTIIMQNKPNFRNAKMNITPVTIKDYENLCLRKPPKNKPNSNPNKPNSKPITNEKCYMNMQNKAKQTQFTPLDGGFRLSNGANPILNPKIVPGEICV